MTLLDRFFRWRDRRWCTTTEAYRYLSQAEVIRPVKPPINLLVYRSQRNVWRARKIA